MGLAGGTAAPGPGRDSPTRSGLWFVVPAHGRVELTHACLRQLARTCHDLAAHGLDATAVIVAGDENLETARLLGFDTVETPDSRLGKRWNDGYEHAGRAGADYLVPLGSDDWVVPELLLDLPDPGEIRCSTLSAVVSEDGRRLTPLRIPYPGGDGVRIFPRALLEPLAFRPADDTRSRAIDTSVLLRLGRGFSIRYLDLHPFQIVDFKSHGEQLNGYDACVHFADGPELDPWETLAAFYPAEAVDEARVVYGSPARSRLMARKISVEILGSSESLERAFARSARAGQRFERSTNSVERSVSRSFRGIAAGSGLVSGLGRSLAFASTGFLGFATVAEGLRKSVDAARDAAVSQRQLATQLKTSGESFQALRPRIEASTEALSALSGFNADELTRSLTTIDRGTRSVSLALKDNAIAADIARGRHVSLATAAVAVGKAAAGSTTALRRLGIQLPKGATGAQGLAIAAQRFAGQARAGATAADRFSATLHNTEVIIGRALLPTLNRYLREGANWLEQMNESGRLQHDVARVSATVARITRDVAAAFKAGASAIRLIDKVTGSFENTLKDLAAVWLVLKARTALIRWGVIGDELVGVAAAARTAAAGLGTLTAAETGVAAASTGVVARVAAYTGGLTAAEGAAAAATRRTAALTAALRRLKGLGTIALVITETTILRRIAEAVTSTPKTFPVQGREGPQTIQGVRALPGGRSIVPALPFGPFGGLPAGGRLVPNPVPDAIADLGKKLVKRAQQAADNAVSGARHVSLQGQFNLDELALAKAQAAGDTTAERRNLAAEAVILKAQAAAAKTLKARTGFYQQLAGVEDQIRGIDSQTLAASQKAATAARKHAAQAKKLAQTFTLPASLQLAEARAQALGKPLTSVLVKMRAAAEKALKSGRLSVQGQIDAWNTIFDVNQQLQDQAKSALGGFRQLNTKKLAESFGLTGDALRRMRAALSQVGPGGTIPAKGVGAFGVAFGADSRPLEIHTHVEIDKRQVGQAVTKVQQKRRLRNPPQVRGPFAGGLLSS